MQGYLQSDYILMAKIILAGPTGNRYAVLKSLDLVCDTLEEQKLWCRAVCHYVLHSSNIYCAYINS